MPTLRPLPKPLARHEVPIDRIDAAVIILDMKVLALELLAPPFVVQAPLIEDVCDAACFGAYAHGDRAAGCVSGDVDRARGVEGAEVTHALFRVGSSIHPNSPRYSGDNNWSCSRNSFSS